MSVHALVGMVPLSQLQFARKYPYTSIAKNVVKQLVPDLSSIDSSAIETTLSCVDACAASSPKVRRKFVESHFSKRELSYAEFLQNDVIAFPLTKIVLSQLAHPALQERFAQLMGDLTFEYVNAEKDKISTYLDLLRELNVVAQFSLEENPIIILDLPTYLSIPLRDNQLHLVHQRVTKGKVVLEWNVACRWLAEKVHAHILSTLPVDTKGLPPVFNSLKQSAQTRLQMLRAQEAKAVLTSGVVMEAFPPCMDKLYTDIMSGVNIPHMARFDLATFLVNVRMPFEDVITVFSKAANYDEKITRYHVGNLAGKNGGKMYSSPACAKVREHGLCISRTCNVTHPLQYYERELSAPKKKDEEKVLEEKNT
ncbi:MAG: hypothetical protein FJY86_02465 [Candidatus Diapherotrites archaeon]|uniref:DNA primase large subunit PriL n=1 Tax=Candidatus Iainarchaeum sp. TaxID=3101447 RepID=A0A8T4C6Y5_9ARCH|nr:hypothetical protein [Candidatus Diapherotrites archaeon]